MRVRFHPDAERELFDAAFGFVKERYSSAAAFTDAYVRARDLICRFPMIGRRLAGGVRKKRILDFPFDVIYIPRRGEVYIIAIASQHRMPGYWRSRLRK